MAGFEAATRAVRDTEDVDAAQRKRAAVEKGCKDLEDKVGASKGQGQREAEG